MHIYYDYLENNFKNSSNVITNWANKNNLHLFDFDNCMYAHEDIEILKNHLIWVKNNYAMLIVVECHPYFPNYDRYCKKIDIIFKIADEINLQIKNLTADYTLWKNTNKDKTFFPDWYFRQRRWAIEHNHRSYNFDMHKKFNFACGNKANLRSEKIYNYIECHRRYRSDWLITIYNHEAGPDHHANISEIDIKNVAGLTDTQIDIWNNEIKANIKKYVFDYSLPDTTDSPHGVIFPVHTDSYCNLVMEHSMEVSILSEKSYKPFIAKQIPIYLASLGAANALKNMGFDLFYDFIDHDLYDNLFVSESRLIENFTIRIDRVHELIDNLYTTNFTDFFHDPNTKQRLQNNQDYFYSDAIDKLCVWHLDQLLNK